LKFAEDFFRQQEHEHLQGPVIVAPNQGTVFIKHFPIQIF